MNDNKIKIESPSYCSYNNWMQVVYILSSVYAKNIHKRHIIISWKYFISKCRLLFLVYCINTNTKVSRSQIDFWKKKVLRRNHMSSPYTLSPMLTRSLMIFTFSHKKIFVSRNFFKACPWAHCQDSERSRRRSRSGRHYGRTTAAKRTWCRRRSKRTTSTGSRSPWAAPEGRLRCACPCRWTLGVGFSSERSRATFPSFSAYYLQI